MVSKYLDLISEYLGLDLTNTLLFICICLLIVFLIWHFIKG